MKPSVCLLLCLLFASDSSKIATAENSVVVTGEIFDANSYELLPARLYIQSSAGKWFWARSTSRFKPAVEYRKQRSKSSVEMHTTLPAHPFEVDLPPGQYTLTVERGKEYFPVTRTIQVGNKPMSVTLKMRRWINGAKRGWYSGDTHVHRSLSELPNIVLAEDLNVALPLTNWVTTAYTPPGRGNKNSNEAVPAELIKVDPTHVIYPVNTEYEIFSVNGQRHTLGAIFVLNHKTQLTPGVPPVGPVAKEARRQGAILDLDKHSWPWSLMLVPVMDVDLFELSNNHVWRTEFAFKSWTIDTNPEFLGVETTNDGWTEKGWTDFGFGTYYTLLNCGFRMRPTAGTASGVHPVPLGFGRVYVYLKDEFQYSDWIEGLNAGRSFVTTGPMLFAKFNGQHPGHNFKTGESANPTCRIDADIHSLHPLTRIEVIVNGDIRHSITPANTRTESGSYQSRFISELKIDGTSWVCVRCFERLPDQRTRFAHTAPVHFDVKDKPLRPKRAEVRYLIQRMEEELARNQNVLKPEAVDEYRSALQVYKKIAEQAE